MPDLTKCVRYDGKTYCWDKEIKQVVEIKITDIPLISVPNDVLVALIEKDGN